MKDKEVSKWLKDLPDLPWGEGRYTYGENTGCGLTIALLVLCLIGII